jgi:signal transduction histidine kinase
MVTLLATVYLASRLAREEFDHIGQVKPGDEFAELATAYNDLARRLQANEARKIETLGQAAVMLNHELNNASAIIKLQLQLLERQSGGNPAFERSLRQINQSLARMTSTVEALKHVRRIVLTDYTPDTKMLDLERSVAEEAGVGAR